jgi:hypothetical protein
MTIHYHGTPITPASELHRLAGRSFCVSFAAPHQIRLCHQIGEGVMIDNGAFTAWRQQREVDWREYAKWVIPWLSYKTTWCVIPDVIDGGEDANDALLAEWHEWTNPHIMSGQDAPVWHLDESIDRLVRLSREYPRVCFGSSGRYSKVGSGEWHERMVAAFNALYADARNEPRCWFHMLRGMAQAGSDYPFASVDSTDLARNHHLERFDLPKRAERWDSLQCPGAWVRRPEQQRLFK